MVVKCFLLIIKIDTTVDKTAYDGHELPAIWKI